MRVLAALVLATVSLATAVYLHSFYREFKTYDLSRLSSYGSAFVAPPTVRAPYRPAWANPAAVLVAVLGVGEAAALLRPTLMRPTGTPD